MDRRRFLNLAAKGSMLTAAFAAELSLPAFACPPGIEPSFAPPHTEAPATLPGTAPLVSGGDLAMDIVEGIRRYLLARTEAVPEERARLWQRDYGSAELYARSVSANRERLRRIIGAVDQRASSRIEWVADVGAPVSLASGNGYTVHAVRWPVCDPVIADGAGLEAEGLLLQPEGRPLARVVALPDADWLPEALAGLAPGVPPASQFARRLAENGCQVVIPLLMNRADTFSGIPGASFTNQPHREWIYRMAFEVGRHIIGYEVQIVHAAVDWFENQNNGVALPTGVAGYGEGGLIALYAAALDSRINVTLVSGYFQEREALWKEPIYRDVWGLVREFGDADLASLVAPRALVVEACRGPVIDGPPPAREGRRGACPNGKLVSPSLNSVQKEFARASAHFARLNVPANLQLIVSGGGDGPCGSEPALRAFLQIGGIRTSVAPSGTSPVDARRNFDPELRTHAQFDRIVAFTQALIRKSPERRREFWARTNSAHPPQQHWDAASASGFSQWSTSPQEWKRVTTPQRDYIWEEVIGRMPPPSLPPNPRTRLLYDQPRFLGYEVMLDVWPDVLACGILLLPKDIQPGERRPVVVCQHGLEGRSRDIASPDIDSHYYRRLGVRLVEEGFVVYAPQNPYIGEDRFRILQRLGHPLKLALFSFIIGQHQQTVDWLAAQTFVDPARIGFYGLSYGGKTAMRVPPFVDRYALSICSGDFNEWVWKTTTVASHYSYLLTGEYDMYEFDFANVVNYAELANLIAPRPFMVERGHHDPVASDDEVAHEYSKVRWFYAYMGIPERTDIEFFEGPHTINGVGTFDFLRRHLRWPKRESNRP